MKYILFTLLLVGINSFSQKIECKYFHNDTQVSGVKYYLIKDNQLLRINTTNDSLNLKNLKGTDELMVVNDNNIFILPLLGLNDYLHIYIYQDNRIFNNIVREKFGNRLKLKNIFKKRYYIDFGIGTATVVYRIKKCDFKKNIIVDDGK